MIKEKNISLNSFMNIIDYFETEVKEITNKIKNIWKQHIYKFIVIQFQKYKIFQ